MAIQDTGNIFDRCDVGSCECNEQPLHEWHAYFTIRLGELIEDGAIDFSSSSWDFDFWKGFESFYPQGNSSSSKDLNSCRIDDRILGFLGDFWGFFVNLILRYFELLDIVFICCLSCFKGTSKNTAPCILGCAFKKRQGEITPPAPVIQSKG